MKTDSLQKNFISAIVIKRALANLPQLTFEITDTCNLKCTYCAYGDFYEDYDERESMFLSINKAKKLIDYLAEYWTSNMINSPQSNIFISFYGGEPLLNMNFIVNIVDYIKALNCPTKRFTFSITTNALLLNKYLEFLVENNFNILISLDGNKENSEYRLDHKGNSVFNKIIENVDLVKEKYPNYFLKNVKFNAVLHNKNSVKEIYDFSRVNTMQCL